VGVKLDLVIQQMLIFIIFPLIFGQQQDKPCCNKCWDSSTVWWWSKSLSGLSNIVDIYDTSTGNWSVEYLSEPVYALAATSVGSKALFGGGHNESYSLFSHADIFELTILRSVTVQNLAIGVVETLKVFDIKVLGNATIFGTCEILTKPILVGGCVILSNTSQIKFVGKPVAGSNYVILSHCVDGTVSNLIIEHEDTCTSLNSQSLLNIDNNGIYFTPLFSCATPFPYYIPITIGVVFLIALFGINLCKLKQENMKTNIYEPLLDPSDNVQII